jgi:hypothetical protein
VIWVGWRQQRTETLIAVALLALLAALLVPTGLEMARAYDHDGLSACVGFGVSESCNEAISAFTSRFEPLSNLVAWITIVPGLFGVLLAAPFVLELEHGTYRLAWTQSITRRRWIVGKLGLAVAGAMFAALALTLAMTWWRAPFVHIQGRMETSAFDSEGIVVFGYTLFALGLALVVGVVWRRAVPALVVGFAGYMAARIFVDTWLRQRLTTPLSATWPITARGRASLDHAWVLSQGPSDRLGHHAHFGFGQCVQAGNGQAKGVDLHCLIQHGGGYTHAIYIPASRFWELQGIETAIFGGIALGLILFAAWWTHERTA